MLTILSTQYKKHHAEHLQKLKQIFLNLMFAQQYKRRLKKYGGTYKKVQRARISHVFLVYGMATLENNEGKINSILEPFFIDYLEC